MIRLWAGCLLIPAAVLFGCSSAEQDWNRAVAANSVAAYQQYLTKHPGGPHQAEAGDRIHSLQDSEDWSEAKQANSTESYKAYLQKEPAGLHTKEAQDAIAASGEANDWKTAQSSGTVASLQDFLKKYPNGATAAQARAKLAEMSGYKVRLTSATTRKQAERVRDRLRRKYGNIVHDLVVAPASSGKGYGVDSSPMSQSQADSTCAQLKKSHQGCEVIKSEAASS
jgi:hypothetical protein